MSWGLILFAIYLLGILFAACVFARPIWRVMGFDASPAHADDASRSEANVIVAAMVSGVAVLWPLTLTLYLLARCIPASGTTEDRRVSAEIDALLEEVYTAAK